MAKTAVAIHLVQTRNAEGDLVQFHPGEALVGFDDAEVKRLTAAGAVQELDAADRMIVTENVTQPVAMDDIPPSKKELPSAREQMEARAQELGVQYRSNISDDKLAEKIVEAESANLAG